MRSNSLARILSLGGLATVGALALSLAVLSGSARADVITLNFAGTITNGTDTTGVFDVTSLPDNVHPTGNLDNYAINIVFTFDTSLGTFSSGPTFSQVVGSGSAVIFINNHSQTIVDGLNVNNAHPQILVNQDNGFPDGHMQASVITNFFNDSTFVDQWVDIGVFDHLGRIPTSIFQPYSLIPIGLNEGTGAFNFEDHQPFQANPFTHQDLASGSFVLDSLLVSVSGVPGPIAGAGLPGMVLAFGGALAWWRKRRQPAGQV